MVLNLTEEEKKLLKMAEINFDTSKDYSDDEILEMADILFDMEMEFEEKPTTDKKAMKLANDYSNLVDKLQNMLPEE
ncbi:hypothetical protein SAMN06296386_10951 [Lachnospiraceae bacterium]|nr:hypothetical protein SAMN06296386_10951 [Lachnospiraceae bacterium]